VYRVQRTCDLLAQKIQQVLLIRADQSAAVDGETWGFVDGHEVIVEVQQFERGVDHRRELSLRRCRSVESMAIFLGFRGA
jgi:hypothetical protein